MINTGDVFYTKKLRSHVGPKGTTSVEYTVKGHVIALLLGHVKPGEAAPTNNQIRALLGEVGFISLDDVEECFDTKTMEKLIKFCEEKFSGKAETGSK